MPETQPRFLAGPRASAVLVVAVFAADSGVKLALAHRGGGRGIIAVQARLTAECPGERAAAAARSPRHAQASRLQAPVAAQPPASLAAALRGEAPACSRAWQRGARISAQNK